MLTLFVRPKKKKKKKKHATVYRPTGRIEQSLRLDFFLCTFSHRLIWLRAESFFSICFQHIRVRVPINSSWISSSQRGLTSGLANWTLARKMNNSRYCFSGQVRSRFSHDKSFPSIFMHEFSVQSISLAQPHTDTLSKRIHTKRSTSKPTCR